MKSLLNKVLIVGLPLLCCQTQTNAATATGTLSVSATIAAACAVNSSNSTISFGAYVSSAVNDAIGTVAVTCTNTTTYDIALGPGNGSGASYADRIMTGASSSALLHYNLYTSAARTTVWGDGSSGTAKVSSTGTGIQQSISVYGRIPASQTTPGPDNYNDSVSITVTY